eukprot:6310798-Pyramimonas_sp.AAC.1
MATEDQGSMSFTITANPQCEEAPLLVKEVSDPEPIAGEPAVSDAHAYMMSQDTKGITFSINDEAFAFTIQILAIYKEGTKWALPDAQAGAPAEEDEAGEMFDIFTSSSGSAAQHGT